jgi:hypothetical protein
VPPARGGEDPQERTHGQEQSFGRVVKCKCKARDAKKTRNERTPPLHITTATRKAMASSFVGSSGHTLRFNYIMGCSFICLWCVSSASRDVFFKNIYHRDGANTIATRTDSKPIIYSYIYLLDLLESHMVAGSEGRDAHHRPERISRQFSPHSVAMGSEHVSYREFNFLYGHLDSSCQV